MTIRKKKVEYEKFIDKIDIVKIKESDINIPEKYGIKKKKKVKQNRDNIIFPRTWWSSEEVEESINDYFDECKKNKRPRTITGLCLSLDTNINTYLDYIKNKKSDSRISELMKKARFRVYNSTEEQLLSGKATAGVIFSLKNHYGWKDKIETETTHIMPQSLIEIFQKPIKKESDYIEGDVIEDKQLGEAE